MIAPTGRDIVLEAHGSRAEIGTIAAVLRSLAIDGLQVTEPTRLGETPAFSNGTILAPWPNRVRDARWRFDGAEQQLAITEPARSNALHGLLRTADYEIRERSDSEVLLGAIIPPQAGWPFFMDTWVRYRLTPEGLAVTHGVINLSGDRAPYATGAHPFLRVGDAPVEELVLTLHAASWFDVDDRLLPVAERAVDGTPYDLREGRRVGELELDTAFGRVRHRSIGSGRGDVAWLDDPTGRRLALWQDVSWTYAQVFTTRAFPGRGGSRLALAVEPMTAPPDALNSGEGLVWLEPGESWEGSWGLRLDAA